MNTLKEQRILSKRALEEEILLKGMVKREMMSKV